MNYKLLVLDIDGTTADSQKKIAPEIRDALIRLQNQGVRVVLASGRPPEGVFPGTGAIFWPSTGEKSWRRGAGRVFLINGFRFISPEGCRRML